MLPLRMLGPLMLMFLLCDADSTCPPELNPLSLDPPEVIGQLGELFSVNCSSVDENYEEMYWKLADRKVSTVDETFLETLLSLTDWNVTAECKIKLNETLECNKNLEITVYQNPQEVFLFPTNNVNAAVEGTQYELQCDVNEVAPVQNLIIRWYKDNQIMATTSFNQTIHKTPVSVSSTMKVNLNRREDGVQFKCEAQLDLGPHGPQLPAMASMYNVSVHYAPEFKSKDMDVIAAFEGNDVTMNCEAEGNPPPVINWAGDGINTTENTSNLIITASSSAIYTCTATNYLGKKIKNIYVRVMTPVRTTTPAVMTTPEAPTPRTGCPLTLTPDEVVVRFGDPVSVNCSTSATDFAGMGWEASSGGTAFQPLSDVTWTVEKLNEWDIEPKCYITLNDNYQCDEIPKITLYKTPDAVSVSASHSQMVEGTEYLLNCNIINVAPVQYLTVKWYRGNETVRTVRFNETRVTPDNVTSTLRVTPTREDNGAVFRCEAELHLGPKGPELIPTETSSPYTAVVLYKPLMKACPGQYTGVENKFSLDMLLCEADGNPLPTVHWHYQGKPINASEPLSRTHSGKHTAEVVNSLGRSSTLVDITIEYSPSFTCNDRYEVQEDGKLKTVCEPEGLPKPVITWFKDERSVATPHHWKRTDSGKYLLKANNKHGEAEHKLYIDVLYAPVFKKGNDTQEVAPGENVTFECSAEGNPLPALRWIFSAVNVMETTGRRQSNITITGATSTNAGVYICVATNKVGSVTRSVTLMMKGKTGGFPSWVIWLLLILLIIIAVMITLIYRNCLKKHGQYDFVPDKAKDIPLTTKSV